MRGQVKVGHGYPLFYSTMMQFWAVSRTSLENRVQRPQQGSRGVSLAESYDRFVGPARLMDFWWGNSGLSSRYEAGVSCRVNRGQECLPGGEGIQLSHWGCLSFFRRPSGLRGLRGLNFGHPLPLGKVQVQVGRAPHQSIPRRYHHCNRAHPTVVPIGGPWPLIDWFTCQPTAFLLQSDGHVFLCVLSMFDPSVFLF